MKICAYSYFLKKEIYKTKKIKINQDFVANQSSSVRVQKLTFVYKEGLG